LEEQSVFLTTEPSLQPFKILEYEDRRTTVTI
ncbi:hypothetical protein T11_6643, partial [Trichinella zimbabwensis]